MIAFKDRRTNNWKVLETGTDESADVDRQVAFAGQRLHDTALTSEQDNYLVYGKWLLLAVRTKEARDALTTALSASPNTTDRILGQRTDKYAALHRVQIQALLGVIDAIVGN